MVRGRPERLGKFFILHPVAVAGSSELGKLRFLERNLKKSREHSLGSAGLYLINLQFNSESLQYFYEDEERRTRFNGIWRTQNYVKFNCQRV